MARFHLSTTNLWSEQQVSINSRTFFHRQCQICGRGFARSLDDGEWRAVHVGALSLDFLDDEITKRYAVNALPVTYLIDRRGHIAAKYVDIVDRANIETNIKALLAEH